MNDFCDEVAGSFREQGWHEHFKKNGERRSKVLEFKGADGDFIYVWTEPRERGREQIQIYVHPDVDLEALGHHGKTKFMSNLIEFPEQYNKGKTPSHKSQSILLTFEELETFLERFNATE